MYVCGGGECKCMHVLEMCEYVHVLCVGRYRECVSKGALWCKGIGRCGKKCVGEVYMYLYVCGEHVCVCVGKCVGKDVHVCVEVGSVNVCVRACVSVCMCYVWGRR